MLSFCWCFLFFLFCLISGSHGCYFVVVACFCFVVVLLLVWDTPTKENTTKKQQNPLFYSVFCAVVLTGLWPQKGQQPKAPPKKIFLFFSKNFFLQKEALGFMLLSFFFVSLAFFSAWIRGPILTGSSGTTKRPDHLFKLVFEGLKFWPKLCPNVLTS